MLKSVARVGKGGELAPSGKDAPGLGPKAPGGASGRAGGPAAQAAAWAAPEKGPPARDSLGAGQTGNDMGRIAGIMAGGCWKGRESRPGPGVLDSCGFFPKTDASSGGWASGRAG